jgi:hypothetical protein
MKKQIVNISPVQTAKVFAVLSFVVSLPFVLMMAIPMMFMPGPQPPFFMGFLVLAPIFYAVFGFVFVSVGAWVYNQLVQRIGGVEYTAVDVDA